MKNKMEITFKFDKEVITKRDLLEEIMIDKYYEFKNEEEMKKIVNHIESMGYTCERKNITFEDIKEHYSTEKKYLITSFYSYDLKREYLYTTREIEECNGVKDIKIELI